MLIRTNRLRHVALAILAVTMLGAWCGCAPRATQAARGSWYELRTPRFQVWTDGDPEAARALVLDLERFHQVIRALTSAEERTTAPPLRIFLAKDRKSFRALTGSKANLAGLFASTMRGNYAIVDAAGTHVESGDAYQPSSRALLFHEYTHYMLSQSGARIPSWYNEGFAEYMSTTEFRDDGRYTVGCVPQSRAAWLQYLEWLPLQKVLAADNVAELNGSLGGTHRTGTHVGSGRNPADSYAQSWYAVHYFLADSGRKAQLMGYLKAWAEGTSPIDAVKPAFGMTVQELDRVLQGYARQTEFECMAVAPEESFQLPAVQVVPLNTGTAHYHVADLLLAMLGPTQSTLDVLDQAAKLEPNDPAILTALARARWLELEDSEGSRPKPAVLAEGERYLQQAVQRASDSPETLALSGHLHRIKAMLARQANQPYADELTAARSAYRRAIRADEILAEAYVGLGATYLIDDNGSKEAQVALEAAAYLLPLDTDIALMLGKIHIARNDVLQAVPALEYVLRWTKSEQQREAAKTALEQLRANAAAPAVSTGSGAAAADE